MTYVNCLPIGIIDEKSVTQQVLVLPILESHVQSLFLSLNHVYGPQLRSASQLDSKATAALNTVEKGLKDAVKRSGKHGGKKKQAKESDVSQILTLQDEIEYWKVDIYI